MKDTLISDSISELRVSYHLDALHEDKMHPDPIKQFEEWFAVVLKSSAIEPNAMALATADASGKPSLRMVLLKGVSSNGFEFYSNYNSRKGLELDQNPQAALLFYWDFLERQVRIEGMVEKLAPHQSDAYFQSRPRGHQLGSLASEQSRVVPHYSYLEKRFEQMSKEYLEKKIDRPAFWGGYRLKPQVIEFWQGRPNRLHDRLRYRLQENGSWLMERLAP